jgi:hypothetical protein
VHFPGHDAIAKWILERDGDESSASNSAPARQFTKQDSNLMTPRRPSRTHFFGDQNLVSLEA